MKLAIVPVYGTEEWYVEPYSEQKELFRGTYEECLAYVEVNQIHYDVNALSSMFEGRTFNTKEK